MLSQARTPSWIAAAMPAEARPRVGPDPRDVDEWAILALRPERGRARREVEVVVLHEQRRRPGAVELGDGGRREPRLTAT
jgi:hypothetical protein